MITMNKPILILLEGPDKSGKGTIYNALNKALDYSAIVVDRFIGSYVAYANLVGRDTPSESDLYHAEEGLHRLFTPLVVYLHAPTTELLARSMNNGEIAEEEFFIKNITPHYDTYMEHTTLNTISIDTAIYTVDECVSIIKDIIDILGEDQNGQ